MSTIFYGIALGISLICSAVYVYMWHKHFDANFTMVFTLVPIANLGYFLHSQSESLGAAINSLQIAFLGGAFLQLFLLLSIINLCRIRMRKRLRFGLFIISILQYILVLTIGKDDLFYKNLSFEIVDGNVLLNREYGVFHTLFVAVLVAFYVAGIVVIIYTWKKKIQIPRTIVSLLAVPNTICIILYIFVKPIIKGVDVLPVGYIAAQIIFLMIAYRVNLYNIGDTAIDSMAKEREVGFASFDFKLRYLGSNSVARELMPFLEKVPVDSRIDSRDPKAKKLLHFIDSFMDGTGDSFVYEMRKEGDQKEKIYNVQVNHLYDGNKRRGFLVTFMDDTANRKYIRLLDSYNEKLQEEVEEKTKHIVDMHDNLIMSLAMMVESRDNSTGGHIKRTSAGVRILVDEIMKEGKISLSKKFCKDIAKAAPMHDLGKIAVDDAILRKPGRFTDEEYEKMKDHAAEGAKVIHEILLNTDDEEFKVVAENVDHFHHERWDGSGYPEGLAGEEIPIEARIMAIADVYDALVSKRVYKEAFTFEKANEIIMDGMGTHFDPALKSAYQSARPRLENYYGDE